MDILSPVLLPYRYAYRIGHNVSAVFLFSKFQSLFRSSVSCKYYYSVRKKIIRKKSEIRGILSNGP